MTIFKNQVVRLLLFTSASPCRSPTQKMLSSKSMRLFQSLIPRIVETKVFRVENIWIRGLNSSVTSYSSETVREDDKRGINF